jgi:hypothetical protein
MSGLIFDLILIVAINFQNLNIYCIIDQDKMIFSLIFTILQSNDGKIFRENSIINVRTRPCAGCWM